MSVILASALLALAATGSEDDNVGAAIAPAIACIDRLYGDPDSSALIDRMVQQLEDEKASRSTFERLAKRAEACGNGFSANPRPSNLVQLYFINRLLIRGLAVKLGSAGLDLALLDRIAAEPGPASAPALNDQQAHDRLGARLRLLGFAPADAERATGYVMLMRFHRMVDALAHPPFRPARLIGDPVDSDDYPRRARIRGGEGDTTVAIRVSESGAVEGCDLISSSGHRRLDARACDVIRQRYRFEPAQDENGRPVAQTVYNRYRWRLD